MKDIPEIIHQVLFNPQVSYPPATYSITDKGEANYTSDYIDVEDFRLYLRRLEEQLIKRLKE